MDTLRGSFGTGDLSGDFSGDLSADPFEFDLGDEEAFSELPPASIGQDERRMQVRAYNHWASLLGQDKFPSIEELEPAELPDFAPYSVLLDFSLGVENPSIQYLGAELAAECEATGPISTIADVPSRSLLSRITDHYMQILANQAPIGFEAEFVNERGVNILYRGILLPFSSDGETIDFIYGVINWKEVASSAEADELLLKIDQALDSAGAQPAGEETGAAHRAAYPAGPAPIADWADAPIEQETKDATASSDESNAPAHGGVLPLDLAWASGQDAELAGSDESDAPAGGQAPLPIPEFGSLLGAAEDGDETSEAAHGDWRDLDEDEEEDEANYSFASLTAHVSIPARKPSAIRLDEMDPAAAGDSGNEPGDKPLAAVAGQVRGSGFSESVDEESAYSQELPEDAGLHDYLAAARELARLARGCEDRSRSALYAAVSRAYDVALAADEAKEEFARLLEENGLRQQARAAMTPVVKLVFGSDYDKTRITEYATVLAHAQRIGLRRGELESFLARTEGGIKGVVKEERALRRAEKGKAAKKPRGLRAPIAEKLREMSAAPIDEIGREGNEFALVLIRRQAGGEVAVLGEIDEDVGLIERAARKILD